MTVTLVVFDRASFELSGKVFDDVAALIDDATVHKKRDFEYGEAYPDDERGMRRLERLRHRELIEQELLEQPPETEDTLFDADVALQAPCSMHDSFLDGNERIDQAISRLAVEGTREAMVAVLDTIHNRMLQNGHFLLPTRMKFDVNDFIDITVTVMRVVL